MTQAQLEQAVARATGETVRRIRHLGFAVDRAGAAVRVAAELRLLLDCPFCGAAVSYPGPPEVDSAAMAACAACDVEFEFTVAEVYTSRGGARPV